MSERGMRRFVDEDLCIHGKMSSHFSGADPACAECKGKGTHFLYTDGHYIGPTSCPSVQWCPGGSRRAVTSLDLHDSTVHAAIGCTVCAGPVEPVDSGEDGDE
jgi:hypothetical protein